MVHAREARGEEKLHLLRIRSALESPQIVQRPSAEVPMANAITRITCAVVMVVKRVSAPSFYTILHST